MKSYKLLLPSLLLLLLGACSDIDGLNDYNAVFSFTITEHKGTGGEIEIGEPVMAGNTIRIPVLHGIHNFPLYFKGEPRFENPIDRITGLDFNDWIEIDLQRGGESGNEPVLDEHGNYIFQEPKFYVQALSGMPREYTFEIDYTATSSDADIFAPVSFADLPQEYVVGDLLTVTSSDVPEEGDMVLFNVAAPQFPLTLTPEFMLSDGATLEGNGTTSYTFETAEDRHDLTVVARDGTTKRWTLGLSVLPVVSAVSAGMDESMLALTDLTGFSAEPGSKGFSIEEHRFAASAGTEGGTEDAAPSRQAAKTGTPQSEKAAATPATAANRLHAAGQPHKTLLRMAASGMPAAEEVLPADTLKLYINTLSGTPFPISIDMEVPLPDGVSLVGDTSDLPFADMESENVFWLLDTVDGIARRWVVVLEEYDSPVASVLAFSYEYTASEVRETSLSGPKVPAIVMDKERTADIDPVNRCIYLRAVEIHNPKYASLDPWELSLTVDIKISSGASLVNVTNFDWSGTDSWKNPKTFGVQASDGTVYEWKVVIRDWSDGAPEASDECELYGVTIKEIRPYTVETEAEPLTVDYDDRTITLNLTRDDNAYPITVAVDYELSEYARIATQNGGRDPLVFDTPETVNTVEVVSESGTNSAEWKFELRPPLKETGTDVTSFRIVSFSESGFSAELVGIDTDNATVTVNFTQAGRFPVTMNFRMGLSYKATSTITDQYGAGTVEFSAIEDKPFTVTAQNGETRQWTLRTTYMPQLQNSDFELWANMTTPLPKGIKGSPYWASANMTSPVLVENTTQTEGAPGQGKAVQMTTKNTIIGKLAAGSLFLGWFDDSNPMGNMNDPTVMMFYGMPFSANKPIKGFQADVLYHPGDGPSSDSGSLAIELIRQRDPSMELEFHGMRPDGTWHPKNNADRVARGQAIVATQSGLLDNGDTADIVVADNTWQTVFVPLEYDGAYPSYTHLTVIFSSSSQGDSFKGAVGSILKIDNIKLIYEE